MKKLCYLLTSITLILIGITPTCAQLKPTTQSALARKMLTAQKYYMTDRVKTMCQEWPGCERWALKRHKENPSFTIIDAEVEYYVTTPKDAWYGTTSVWHYNLYVETMENLQKQTYVFSAQEDHFNTEPVKYKKFPGHPFTNMPSEHAKYEYEQWGSYLDSEYPPKSSKICKRWPDALYDIWKILDYAREQQRVVWDKNGNPRWERRLDVTLKRWDGDLPIALIARQQKLGAPFEYLSARKTTSILKKAYERPSFSFAKKY